MSLSASFLPQGYLVSSYQLLEEVYLMFEDLHLKVFKKSLKVFRLKAAILGVQFVNLMMFNCSLLSKTCLNVYRPKYIPNIVPPRQALVANY